MGVYVCRICMGCFKSVNGIIQHLTKNPCVRIQGNRAQHTEQFVAEQIEKIQGLKTGVAKSQPAHGLKYKCMQCERDAFATNNINELFAHANSLYTSKENRHFPALALNYFRAKDRPGECIQCADCNLIFDL